MDDFNLIDVAVAFIVVFSIQLWLVWKDLQSLFDPMFYFIVTTSFALTFASLHLHDSFLLARVFLYFVFFWIGYKFVMSRADRHEILTRHLIVDQDRLFPVLLVLGVLVCLVLNVYAWASAGIPLLSDNPSLQKAESLNAGLGYVRRFNWGVAIYIFVGSLYWYIYSRNLLPLICMLLMSTVSILGGAKSAFLPVLFGLGLYIASPFLDRSGGITSEKIRRHTGKIISVSVVPVVAVFLIESDGYESALVALVTRLLYFGDTMIFWGDEVLRSHFTNKVAPQDYPAHFLNSILGLFRLIPYEPAFGNQFVQFSLGAGEEFPQSLGPNTPFYVKGELFFGFLYATLYSFCIGCVVAYFRYSFIFRHCRNLTAYTLKATLVIIAMTIPTEDSLFVSKFFDFMFVYCLLYIASKIFVYGGVYSAANGHLPFDR